MTEGQGWPFLVAEASRSWPRGWTQRRWPPWSCQARRGIPRARSGAFLWIDKSCANFNFFLSKLCKHLTPRQQLDSLPQNSDLPNSQIPDALLPLFQRTSFTTFDAVRPSVCKNFSFSFLFSSSFSFYSSLDTLCQPIQPRRPCHPRLTVLWFCTHCWDALVLFIAGFWQHLIWTLPLGKS